jgi:hypothetical protein
METTDREIIYDVKKTRGLSIVELEELLKQWQVKLQMEDWTLSVKIVEFRRKNGYRQSGDFIADLEKKQATILMTNDPWRGDEEYTLVHEMLHTLFYDYDKYSEDLILKNVDESSEDHDTYMEKLEETVHHLTRIIVGRSDR